MQKQNQPKFYNKPRSNNKVILRGRGISTPVGILIIVIIALLIGGIFGCDQREIGDSLFITSPDGKWLFHLLILRFEPSDNENYFVDVYKKFLESFNFIQQKLHGCNPCKLFVKFRNS